MILFDVNVLLNAHRDSQEHHRLALDLIQEIVGGRATYAVSELVLSAFVRVVTNPRAMSPPTSVGDALAVCADLRNRPNARLVAPGPRHWEIFEELCVHASAGGNLVPDAYLAALAIESGCEWVSFDRDFARFPGLRWRSPLD